MSRVRKREGKKRKTHYTDIDVAKRVAEIAQLKLQGKSIKDIEKYMTITYEISEYVFRQYLEKARDRVRELLNKDLVNVRVVHADRYEWFYNTLYDWGFDKYAMEALGNVERLLGWHSNSIAISIDNLVQKKKQPNLYDYTKLSVQELKRLKQLVDKCKKK